MPNVMIRTSEAGDLLFYVAKKDMEETIATVEVDTECGVGRVGGPDGRLHLVHRSRKPAPGVSHDPALQTRHLN